MIFEQRKTFPADNTFRIDDDDMGNLAVIEAKNYERMKMYLLRNNIR